MAVMQLRSVINLHKGLTPLLVLALMALYGNWSIGPWVYLALHGTYGMLWLLKDRWYPDRQWQQPITWPVAVGGFAALGLYWLAPWLLIRSGAVPPPALVAAAVAICLLGGVPPLRQRCPEALHASLPSRPDRGRLLQPQPQPQLPG
jgi:hypothetical protein